MGLVEDERPVVGVVGEKLGGRLSVHVHPGAAYLSTQVPTSITISILLTRPADSWRPGYVRGRVPLPHGPE